VVSDTGGREVWSREAWGKRAMAAPGGEERRSAEAHASG